MSGGDDDFGIRMLPEESRCRSRLSQKLLFKDSLDFKMVLYISFTYSVCENSSPFWLSFDQNGQTSANHQKFSP